jgi:hypothetical protein
MTVEEFAAAVVAYCHGTQGSVTSWCRSIEHNRVVGGVHNSPHLAGLGADIVYDAGADPHPRAHLASVLRLWRLVEGDHDHLQPEDWHPG